MNYFKTLSKYIWRSFLLWNGLVLFVLGFVSFLFNIVELSRRAHGNVYISFGHLVKISLLQLPNILDQLSPLIFLFSTMILLWIFHKRSEITIIRSLGYSIWDIITPMILSVLIYSIFYFSFLNPLLASLKEKSVLYQNQVFRKVVDLSLVSKSGLWLKYSKEDQGYKIIHATSVLDQRTLGNSTIYDFSSDGKFIRRCDVEKINILPEKWILVRPYLTESNDIQRSVGDMELNIHLTLQKIQKTFQSPSALSFWQLPGFIKLVEETGFSSTEHVLYFFNLLMKPLMLISMVLIGGVCAFISLRRENAFVFILSGIFAGFFLHFLYQVFYALGESSKIPLFLSALIPAFISILIGLILLVHLEES